MERKTFEEMTFEEVVEHLSSVYINADNCDVCQKANKILADYKFCQLRKIWDYDD